MDLEANFDPPAFVQQILALNNAMISLLIPGRGGGYLYKLLPGVSIAPSEPTVSPSGLLYLNLFESICIVLMRS